MISCLTPRIGVGCQLAEPEEVARLIDAAGTLFRRTLLMTLYATGMRRSELARLKVSDIDSQRMIIRVVEGKGGKDRDLPLSPALLETLREYWRWRKPRLYLFPTRTCCHRLDQPISDKTVWIACSDAARRAGIRKRVTPHTLRHYLPCLTMSSDIGQRSAQVDKIVPQRGCTERITRHSLLDATGCSGSPGAGPLVDSD